MPVGRGTTPMVELTVQHGTVQCGRCSFSSASLLENERERERYCTGKVDSVEHPNLVLRSGSLGKPSTTSAQYVRAYVALGTVKVGSTNKSPRTQNFNWDRLANKSLRALRSPNASTAVKMHN